MAAVHRFVMKKALALFLVTGQKTLEVRLGHEYFKVVKVGDEIIFNGYHRRTVVAVRKYPSFEATVLAEDCRKILPGAKPGELLLAMKENLQGDVTSLGVLVFELQAY